MRVKEDRIILQLYDGIAELVNGEYDSSRMVDFNFDDKDIIRVTLVPSSPAFRETLLREIHENLSRWRVNPFINVFYDEENRLVFNLRPYDEIKKAYMSRLGGVLPSD